MRAERNTKKKRKWLRITGTIFLILFIALGAYVFSLYNSLSDAVETMHQPIDREGRKIAFNNKEPFTVLMLGVDERAGDKGRSDTVIALTINPEKKSVKMLSIPRDTRTEIVGRGTQDKINHAYAFGGVEMSMDTVEKFLDIPIDYYVKMNMEGFQDIVDAVGGVTVNNTREFTEGKFHFAQGQIDLNGQEALAYVRMRKSDPEGDFGRQNRQRQIIQGIVNKGASVGTLTKFDNIFEALGKNVSTNITFDEMKSIQSHYKSAAGNIEQMKIEGSGTKINGIYYWVISPQSHENIKTELKNHLNL
ncbi:LytR family transcriptional regulator [Mesobacillus subterraneus]|uniref:Polyisoprenyl-teichoic acid--peptidoglycan teichoic acid transferase TagU n=1 Tax=Mesobacillus subterraneus TaxID=285983 RepID=A0A3R9E3C5_9BACI|nr:LytR family transcriptional regulator [Mesobacillus subterraneus]RSD25225.1 LytR family transcriptional regulator [Mesobacillus subterraneus]